MSDVAHDPSRIHKLDNVGSRLRLPPNWYPLILHNPMTLSSAFLICHAFLSSNGMYMGQLHEGTYNALAHLENGEISLNAARRQMALVDSIRGIALGDCLYELYNPTHNIKGGKR